MIETLDEMLGPKQENSQIFKTNQPYRQNIIVIVKFHYLSGHPVYEKIDFTKWCEWCNKCISQSVVWL